MKVLVCDDLPEKDRGFEETIENARQPDIITKRLCGNSLKRELSTLFDNAEKVLSKDENLNNLQTTEFDDEVDLVILDNNLAHLHIQGARLTAEAIAGYIRAFSSAPYIVSINKNPDIDFDLRYLVGDYTTRADLSLNTRHLSNPALWTGRRAEASRGFLPWYWPKLQNVGAKRHEQIKFIKEHLGKNIGESFGISTDDFNFLSRQARSLLSQAEGMRETDPKGDETSGMTATFREVFLASSRSLPNEEERRILNAKSEQNKDGIEVIMARIIASDIDLWFRRDVLGPQEVLVDLPHLLMRMPFLLGNDAGDIESWNAVVDARKSPPFGLNEALFADHLESEWFNQCAWADQPCFWWSRLRENDELNAFFSTVGMNWAEAVFCEDRSEFLPRDTEDEARAPLEFVTQFECSWNRRFVAGIEGVRYVPRVRFAK